MCTAKSFFTIVLLSLSILSFGQSINANWEQELNKAIDAFKKCDQTMVNNVNPCSKYIGESVNTVYKVNDFYSEKLGRYLTGTEIIKYLESNDQWKVLGYAYDQKALNEANDYANANKAVVAVRFDDVEKIGGVAVILPGKMITSGYWGFDVPNSASFIINEPEKSYVNEGLSYAFRRTMIRTVVIYGKIY